jgi:hypothetical protein
MSGGAIDRDARGNAFRHSGALGSGEPGIHILCVNAIAQTPRTALNYLWLWIPGSRPWRTPE